MAVFYFKSPQFAAGLYAEHDLFIQHTKLKNTLRWLMGEEQITHLGIGVLRIRGEITLPLPPSRPATPRRSLHMTSLTSLLAFLGFFQDAAQHSTPPW